MFKDGSYYEGEFKDDEINGIGTYYDSHKGTEYSGQWRMGEKHGKGLLKYSDGSHYNGEWEANVCQGWETFIKNFVVLLILLCWI